MAVVPEPDGPLMRSIPTRGSLFQDVNASLPHTQSKERGAEEVGFSRWVWENARPVFETTVSDVRL
jgi:hypothetical protein